MGSLLVVNGFWTGVLFRTWIDFIQRLVPERDLRRVALKVALNQFIVTPLVYMPFFHVAYGAFMGQSTEESWRKFRAESFALDARMWMIYIPSNTILFMFIPVQYQIVWTSSVSLLWNVVLSLYTHAVHCVGIVATAGKLTRFGSESGDLITARNLVSDLYPFGNFETWASSQTAQVWLADRRSGSG